MSLVIRVGPARAEWWREHLQGLLPELECRLWDDPGDPDEVRQAVVWKPPVGGLKRFANLEVIVSIGAGIDHVLADTELPRHVPIIRTTGADLSRRMREYVCLHVLRLHRRLPEIEAAQMRREWLPLVNPPACERRVGVKMGLTSRAKMVQVGVDEVIWGRLTDAMRVEEGGEASFARYVHPRVEPEIAFLMADDLSGNVSPAEAMSAVEAVAPALEIIDSRYRDFKFSLPDVVADHSSSSGFVVGNWRDPETDLSNLGMILEANGRPVQMGSSAAILGDPVRALVAAARMVARWGEKLEAGMIVLAGAATAAHPTPAGTHMRVTVQDLGAVSFTMAE